jgi:hypothetical protein
MVDSVLLEDSISFLVSVFKLFSFCLVDLI